MRLYQAYRQQRNLNIESGAKSQHHAGKAGVAITQFIQNEQYRRRRHVATSLEDADGCVNLCIGKFCGFGGGSQDSGTAGMDGPALDFTPRQAIASQKFIESTGSVRVITPGTSGDNVISNPLSPIFHVISSLVSGITKE